MSVTAVRGVVGESARRIDGEPKVRGSYSYGSDLETSETAHGVTVRSPHASARIRSIDVSAASTVVSWSTTWVRWWYVVSWRDAASAARTRSTARRWARVISQDSALPFCASYREAVRQACR